MERKHFILEWEHTADGRSPSTWLGGQTPPGYWKLSHAALAAMFSVRRMTCVFSGVPALLESAVRIGRWSEGKADFVGAYECSPADGEQFELKNRPLCIRRGVWNRPHQSEQASPVESISRGCSVDVLFVTGDLARTAESMIQESFALLKTGISLSPSGPESKWCETRIGLSCGYVWSELAYPASLQPSRQCQTCLEEWFTWAFELQYGQTLLPDSESQFTMSYERGFEEQLAYQ